MISPLVFAAVASLAASALAHDVAGERSFSLAFAQARAAAPMPWMSDREKEKALERLTELAALRNELSRHIDELADRTPRTGLVLRGENPTVLPAVRRGSPAAEAGIEPGDELRRVNDWPVELEDIETISKRLAASDPVTVTVFKKGGRGILQPSLRKRDCSMDAKELARFRGLLGSFSDALEPWYHEVRSGSISDARFQAETALWERQVLATFEELIDMAYLIPL